eukprot:gene7807-11997_t
MRFGRALWRLFGPVPDVGARCEHVLFYVSLAFFWELYDLSLSMSVLSHVATEFAIDRAVLAYASSFVRFGAFPALLLTPLADKFGRRIVFVSAVLGISLATCATAFSRSVEQYVACQMVCRCFVELCSATGFVIVTEEFPADHRGWGMGILGATGALGFGMGAVLFAAVDVLPFGWRFLYFLGILPVFLLPTLLREVPETERFHKYRLGLVGADPKGATGPYTVCCTHTKRVLAVVVACFTFSAGNTGVFQFSGYHVMSVKHWAPWQLSVLVVCAGSVGVMGNVIVGRLGDSHGRKPVACAISVAYPLLAYLFYHAGDVALAFSWAALTFCSVAMNVLIRTLTTEVFPTDYRSTAGGFVSVSNALGGVVGLGLVGYGAEQYSLPDM